MIHCVAVIEHNGGCDHTVHCGTKVDEIETNDGFDFDNWVKAARLTAERWNGTVKFYEVTKEINPP